MVHLKPVTQDNYYDCLQLKREETRFVGNACDVIADAYIYRETSLAYAIYYEDDIIGLVILGEQGKDQSYEFTNLFIADDYRNQGFGEQTVKAIIDHFIGKNAKSIRLQVHKSNEVAVHIYQKCGFLIKGASKWDADFWVMEMVLT